MVLWWCYLCGVCGVLLCSCLGFCAVNLWYFGCFYWYIIYIAGSSNGRTFGSGPKNRGSSPCPATTNSHTVYGIVSYFQQKHQLFVGAFVFWVTSLDTRIQMGLMVLEVVPHQLIHLKMYLKLVLQMNQSMVLGIGTLFVVLVLG